MKCNLIPSAYRQIDAFGESPLRWDSWDWPDSVWPAELFFNTKSPKRSFIMKGCSIPSKGESKAITTESERGRPWSNDRPKRGRRHLFPGPSCWWIWLFPSPIRSLSPKSVGRDKGAVVEGLTATPDGARKWQGYLQGRRAVSGGRDPHAAKRRRSRPFFLRSELS